MLSPCAQIIHRGRLPCTAARAALCGRARRAARMRAGVNRLPARRSALYVSPRRSLSHFEFVWTVWGQRGAGAGAHCAEMAGARPPHAARRRAAPGAPAPTPAPHWLCEVALTPILKAPNHSRPWFTAASACAPAANQPLAPSPPPARSRPQWRSGTPSLIGSRLFPAGIRAGRCPCRGPADRMHATASPRPW